VTVAVDPDLGEVEILDYVIVEDGGVLVNPMIVDGQIFGGLAQGIGTALYEEMPFDSAGQPLATTLADYLLPGPTEVPEPRSTTWRRRRPTPCSASRASAKAAPSRRRPPSPMRERRAAAARRRTVCIRRSRHAALVEAMLARARAERPARMKAGAVRL
jgi:carbon-monoxide dehydrogenase large subunit